MVDSKENHYQRWSDPDLVEKFSKKTIGDFFRTELWALEQVDGEIDTVLDIGSASGRMIELLHQYTDRLHYTGVDISAENVERGRRMYPEAEFHLVNGLDFNPGITFSLVNATGVCQHEPRFEALIRHMIDLSRRFIMFDVKFAAVDQSLIDRECCFCQFSENRLYYVLLAPQPFFEFLRTLPGVKRAMIWGYDTHPSHHATVPQSIDRLVSAGVLIEKGSGPCQLEIDLPAWLGRT